MSTGRRPSVANTLGAPRAGLSGVALAHQRGREALEAFAKAERISIAEARARLEKAGKAGRRRSAVMGCP